MAGKDLYIGKMLQSLESNINSLKTDMGTMSGDMASMVAELIALKTTMGQGIAHINALSSNNIKITTDSDIPIAPTLQNTYKKGMQIYSCMNGSFRLNLTLSYWSQYSYTNKIGYSLDNGSNWTDLATLVTETAGDNQLILSDKDFAVKYGDVLVFGVLSSHVNPTYNKNWVFSAGATIGYDIVDVVNDGALLITT